jgi:integrase/recombinase XerD
MSHTEFLERKARNSESTKQVYQIALSTWAFANSASIDSLVTSIKESKIDVYDSLDKFVSYLIKQEKAPKTITSYVAGVRAFLSFSDIAIAEHRFRAKVAMPKQYEISSDKIPTKEELQKLFLHSSLKVRTLIGCLCATGLRIGELLKIKVGQINFETKPARIMIMAKETKTRKTRTVFLTDEAISLLKEYLGDRIAERDSYVFGGNKPMTKGTAYDIITHACQKAELRFKLDRDSKRYAIHPHVFRKFFMTRLLSSGMDRGVIEALMGHKFGLDSAYLRLTEEEIGNMYLNAMSNLTIMNSGEITKDEIRNEVELGVWHFMVSSGWGEPSTLIKNYDLLPTTEKVKALKSVMLKVVHEAGDFLEISDPGKLTVEHLGITLPSRNNMPILAGPMLLENPRKYDSILLSGEDEQKVLTYSNRGYEIAGTINGRILMRKAL